MIIISYPLRKKNGMVDFSLEKEIEKAIGKPCEGSGVGFGKRDLEFYEVSRQFAIAKLQKAGLLISRVAKCDVVYLSELK